MKAANFVTNQLNYCWKTINIEICSTHNEGKSVVAEIILEF